MSGLKIFRRVDWIPTVEPHGVFRPSGAKGILRKYMLHHIVPHWGEWLYGLSMTTSRTTLNDPLAPDPGHFVDATAASDRSRSANGAVRAGLRPVVHAERLGGAAAHQPSRSR